MAQVRRSALVRYGFAVLTVALAAAITWFFPLLGNRIPFALFYAAVMLSAWYGGKWPGLLATGLSALLSAFFFLNPKVSVAINLEESLLLGVFVLVSLVIISLMERARRAEMKERTSREQLLITLRSIGDAVIATDAQGHVTFMNEVAQELTGWKLSEAEGRELREIFQIVNEETREEVESPVAKVIRVGSIVGLANHTLLIAKDGTEIPIDDSGAPIKDEAGNLTGVVLAFRHIGERRRAEELSQRLASIVESSEDAIIGKTLEGIITSWNASAVRLYHYSAEEAVGRSVSILAPPDRPDEVPGILDRLKRGERIEQYETRRVKKDGTVINVALTISPIKNSEGAIIGAATIARDITERQLAEDALRESEARFRRVVESNIIGVSFSTLDGEITDANDAYLQMLGCTREELRAGLVRWDEMTPREYRHLDERAIEEIKETGACVPFEKEHIRKDGTRVPVLIGSARLDETSQSCVCFIVNLTEQKRAANRTARLQSLTAALSEAMTPVNAASAVLTHGLTALGAYAGSVALLNEQGGELELLDAVGFPAEMIEKWRCFPVSSEAPLAEAVRTSQMVLIESLQARDSRYLHLSALHAVNESQALAAVPLIVEGRTIGAMGMTFREVQRFDEDDRAYMLAIARQCAQAIERARLYQAERRMRAEAEEANRTKDEFLATLSHELRTPLTAMLGWTRMLRMKELDEETSERALETVERNARVQAQLIEDLLDVSRIITGKLRLDVRPMELMPVIEAAIDAVRPAAAAKNIELQTALDPLAGPVSGDPNRLQQVVWNLLANAVKFTPGSGQVKVSLERVDAHVEVIVSDTGQGIKPDFLPYVFDRFRQADGSSTRLHGGLGLGLAIVRHLIELHGGTVRAESSGEGQGATFHLQLPLMPVRNADFGLQNENQVSAPLQSPIRNPHSATLRGLRVLVVDDEQDARHLIATVLEKQGAEVFAAGSAREALGTLEREMPDVLISDLGMPDEDGLALIRQVRERGRESGGEIPAAAVSAYAGEDNRQQALAAGFQLHVAKPVDPQELIEVVRSLAEEVKKQ
jgi:PAS domain S-box-containing protein